MVMVLRTGKVTNRLQWEQVREDQGHTSVATGTGSVRSPGQPALELVGQRRLNPEVGP